MTKALYSIKEVDAFADDENADILKQLHELTFLGTAPKIDPAEGGHWWLVHHEKEPVAFCGLTPSTYGEGVGYLKRVGVLEGHRGHGLQRRMIRVREARARRNGWHMTLTDTTDNVPSANSLIRAGYTMFDPPVPWGMASTLYWRKMLNV
jgi:GNAT superfamily N-acetyltransferase